MMGEHSGLWVCTCGAEFTSQAERNEHTCATRLAGKAGDCPKCGHGMCSSRGICAVFGCECPHPMFAGASDGDVDSPSHYTAHPSGVECIQITEHMGFCLGNAIKYLWRAGLKSGEPSTDLRKAIWYLERELKRIEKR